MNKLFTFLSIIIILFSSNQYSFGQWSTDPYNPGVVCNAPMNQTNLKTFADDNGGVYIFWQDGRNSSSFSMNQVFGQHFNEAGESLWEANGRLIVEHPNNLSFFNVAKFENGEIMIGWTTTSAGYPYPDSLHFQRLDEDGHLMWTQDLIAAFASAATSILSINGFNWIHDNTGYVIDIWTIYYGGASGNRITRFDNNGNLTGSLNGDPAGTQFNFGSSGLLPAMDGSDDIYLYYSAGNGAGAGLLCMRLTSSGTVLWGPTDVIAGTTGLSYQFTAFSDPGGITFIWQGNSINAENIYARRYSGSGNIIWGDVPLGICTAEGTQTNFFCRMKGNAYYIVWADGRPGTNPGYYDIYAQKFDTEGTLHWNADGVLVASFNTYIPYPAFTFADNNSLIISHQSTTVGFNSQKVNDNGEVLWLPDGYQICSSQYNPFYAQHKEVFTGDQVIAIWSGASMSGGDSYDIYASKITQQFTSLSENLNSDFQLYLDPSGNELFIKAKSPGSFNKISISDLSGRIILEKENLEIWEPGIIKLQLGHLSHGIYLIVLSSQSQSVSRKFVKR
jgi:hypothetical protein